MADKKETRVREMDHWWQDSFWRILVVGIVLIILTIPVPLYLKDSTATIVLTWVSILASVAGTWFFAFRSFNTTLIQKQKERARVAVRRPMEIAKGVRSILRFVENKSADLVGDTKRLPDESGRVVVKNVLENTSELLRLLHGHVLSAIDDWADLIGDEIQAAALFAKEFEDLVEEHRKEKAKLADDYLEKEKDLKAGAEEEKNTLRKEFEEKQKEQTTNYFKRLQDLRDLQEELMRPIRLPWFERAATLPSGSLGSLSSSLPDVQQFADSLVRISRPFQKCPFCGSDDIDFGPSGMAQCKSCKRTIGYANVPQ